MSPTAVYLLSALFSEISQCEDRRGFLLFPFLSARTSWEILKGKILFMVGSRGCTQEL